MDMLVKRALVCVIVYVEVWRQRKTCMEAQCPTLTADFGMLPWVTVCFLVSL
jgi:hypothetical protein